LEKNSQWLFMADNVNSRLSLEADRREIQFFSKGRFRRVWATAALGQWEGR
jgi:hypothetical protein